MMKINMQQPPKGWVNVKLGEIAEIKYGKGLPTKQLKDSGYPVFGANGVIGYYDEFLYEDEQLLISCRGANSGTINFSPKKCFITNNSLIVNFCAETIQLRKTLFYFLQSTNKERLITGTAQPQVTINNAIELELSLPPISEQHRIVAKIEELFSELDKGIENLKTAQAQLKVYRQALLKHAFEGRLTAQWRAQRRAQQSVAPAKAGAQPLNDMDSRPTPSRGLALRGNDEMGGRNDKSFETAADLLKRIQQERAQRYQQQLADWEVSGKQGSKPKPPKSLPPLTTEELAELPELPEGWGWTRLGNTNVDVSDGPFGSNLKSSDYVDAGVRVIRLENIGALEFIEDKESFITETKYELLKNHTVKSGDIIFSSFITENVRVAMLPASIQRAVNKADCFCLRLYGETLGNAFVVMFLSTRHVFKQLEAQIHGVGRPRINTTQLKEVAIPICGIQEQQFIISSVEARLSEADQLNQTITTALQKAEVLRQSILKKAFSGQLVPQDPNDEPASELLARIKAERLASQGNEVVRRKGGRS